MTKEEQIAYLIKLWRDEIVNDYRLKYYLSKADEIKEEKMRFIQEIELSTYYEARSQYEAMREKKEKEKQNG